MLTCSNMLKAGLLQLAINRLDHLQLLLTQQL